MSAIRHLAEVVVFVDDMEQSLRFYRDLLGLSVISPAESRAVFLRVGAAGDGVPEQIVLVPRPPGARPTATTKAEHDLHHIGLEVAAEDFASERERIARLGIPIRSGEHPFLPVEAFYLDDPDGNEVEIVARTG
jgi:catechol 2,3-dioxygenase-like lactoylglutathione lyase family enzyme